MRHQAPRSQLRAWSLKWFYFFRQYSRDALSRHSIRINHHSTIVIRTIHRLIVETNMTNYTLQAGVHRNLLGDVVAGDCSRADLNIYTATTLPNSPYREPLRMLLYHSTAPFGLTPLSATLGGSPYRQILMEYFNAPGRKTFGDIISI